LCEVEEATCILSTLRLKESAGVLPPEVSDMRLKEPRQWIPEKYFDPQLLIIEPNDVTCCSTAETDGGDRKHHR